MATPVLASTALNSGFPASCPGLVWQLPLFAMGALGVIWAGVSWLFLPRRKPHKQAVVRDSSSELQTPGCDLSTNTMWLGNGTKNIAMQQQQRNRAGQVAALCFAHGVIGWGFFVFSRYEHR
jgi:heme/copper-type cytochrome/quinol oxidase subunit 3